MERKRCPVLIATMLAFFALPEFVRADPGSALMWLPSIHLTFGNLIIGIAEGVLIGLLFRGAMGLAVPIMIAANYLSWLAGYGLVEILRNPFQQVLEYDLYHAKFYLAGAWGFMIALTAIVEYPCCYLIFRKSPGRWRKSILAFLVSQAASYSFLLFVYFNASTMDVLIRPKLVRTIDFAKAPRVSVYFLSLEDGSLWRRRLDGSPAEKMIARKAMNEMDMLLVKSSEAGRHQDVWISNQLDFVKPWEMMIMQGGKVVAASLDDVQYPPLNKDRPHYRNGIPVPMWDAVAQDLRPAGARTMNCEFTRYNDGGGMKPVLKWNEQSLRLLIESPLLEWGAGVGAILPDDQVIFQLHRWIVLMDLHTMQMGIIAEGRMPVAMLE